MIRNIEFDQSLHCRNSAGLTWGKGTEDLSKEPFCPYFIKLNYRLISSTKANLLISLKMESLKRVVKFNHGILMIGFGAVASCTLPLLTRQLDMPLSRITIIDERQATQLEDWVKKGVKFIQSHITKGLNC